MSTPVGPYTPAMRAGPYVVCSGQIGIENGSPGVALAEGGLGRRPVRRCRTSPRC